DVAIAAGNQIGITPSGQTLTIAANSTSANTANTLVQRNSAGGFAAGALTLGGRIDQTSIEGLVARGTSGSGTIPATGPGTRLMWYPRKGAFRVGAVDGGQWDDASIGGNSIAMGFDTIASDGSTALGYKTTASNLYTTAMGSYTTASGGNATAMGSFTTASGGDSFAIGAGSIASGYAAFATGTLTIASGDNSTAMGLYASTSSVAGTVETPRTGVFVYGDTSTSGTGVLVRPTQDNQFVVRATGGVLFYTGVDGSTGDPTTGVSLDANGTSWTSISDRNRKEDFLAVDSEAVLRKLAELPVTSWRYKNDVSRQRYIGPMAQDFHGLFGLGTNRTIATLDVDGVTLAGIKALEKRTANLQTENVALRGQLETLILRVQALEANSRH
ncbi:MAG: tail fiber domain-containing protein, partial [Thermoanaerobaculia bacterium]